MLHHGSDKLTDSAGQLRSVELRQLLEQIMGESEPARLPVARDRLAPGVYRLRFQKRARFQSLVVKRLNSPAAYRVRLVAERWLPALGMGQHGPPLLGVAAERDGRYAWHVYEDLGDWCLDERAPDRSRVECAVGVVAQVHARFADHALLAECRLWGSDFGRHFYTSSLRDAIRGLETLRTADLRLSRERAAVRNDLLEQLNRFRDEAAERERLVEELGGPETLLHGDLWPQNVIVSPIEGGHLVRLVDWDQMGVGPIAYDLSAFLRRFPARDQCWILELYEEAFGSFGWRLPPAGELKLLFDTCERARLVSCVAWRVLAALDGHSDWAFDELARLQEWLQALQPDLVHECGGSDREILNR